MRLPESDLRVLLRMNMFNLGAYPRGYDFENFLRKQAMENFKSINKHVKKKRVNYTMGNKQVTSQNIMKHLKEILNLYNRSQLTRMYYDSEHGELVVEKGVQEPIRFYDLADLKWLSAEDNLALEGIDPRTYEVLAYESSRIKHPRTLGSYSWNFSPLSIQELGAENSMFSG
ncbi:hypothetical protein L1987_23053 [Smallanthus sonchifolius]|uniref:Uncharacterized protein n=1 Tax=Smallanthus sonchifolius TaxID=185202 RepID=A0ACB9IFV0_9ASTR|nr:hypothetical protein L1987_23053 [Smallanthus sonchifolius]